MLEKLLISTDMGMVFIILDRRRLKVIGMFDIMIIWKCDFYIQYDGSVGEFEVRFPNGKDSYRGTLSEFKLFVILII